MQTAPATAAPSGPELIGHARRLVLEALTAYVQLVESEAPAGRDRAA